MNIQEIIKAEADAILHIPHEKGVYEIAVNTIYDATQKLEGKVITSGMGKAGEVAHNIATTFCSTGIPAVYLHPGDAQHGDIGVIQKHDVLLLVSNSGETKELVDLVYLTYQLHNNPLPMILITGSTGSQLGCLSDICLKTGSPKEVCPLGLTPTTSTTVMSVIGDVLTVLLMQRTHLTDKEYYKRHHGGYIGQLIKTQINNERKS